MSTSTTHPKTLPVEKQWPVIVRLMFDERVRRAIAHRYGKREMASINDCKLEVESVVSSVLADYCHEYDDAQAEGTEDTP